MEIQSLLGITPEGGVQKCDPESKEQYNSKVSELVLDIKNNTVDAETKVNLDYLHHLAQSIKIK